MKKNNISLLCLGILGCLGLSLYASEELIELGEKVIGAEELLDPSDATDLTNFGVTVETGDIQIGPINILTFDTTSCNYNLSTTCQDKSSCNITVGPCKYMQSTAPAVTKGGSSLNAAPTDIVFTRYLKSNNPSKSSVRPGNSVKLKLTPFNNFTQIIQTTYQGKPVSYMIMLLPTKPDFVSKIKNLPAGLARYLKSESGKRDLVVKVYSSIDNSSTWNELSDLKIDVKSVNDHRINIFSGASVNRNGELVITYNHTDPSGKNIKTTVTHKPF